MLIQILSIYFRFLDYFGQKMGCLQSSEAIDFDTIQPVVLQTRGGIATYSGSTGRGGCQVRLVLHYFTIFFSYRR